MCKNQKLKKKLTEDSSKETASTNVYKPFLSSHLFGWKIKVVIPALEYFPRVFAEIVMAYLIRLLKIISYLFMTFLQNLEEMVSLFYSHQCCSPESHRTFTSALWR